MKKKWFIVPLVLVSTIINAQDATLTDTNEMLTTEVIEGEVLTNEMMTNTMTVESNANLEMGTIDNTNITSLYVQTVKYTITNGEQLFASPMARFEVQGIDEQSGLQEILVSVDGGDYTVYKYPISFTTEGEHSLNYKFVDRVGNISYSKTFSVTVDATAPRIVELELNPAPYKSAGSEYVGPNTEFYFRSYDDTTGVGYIEFTTSSEQAMIHFETNTTFASLGYTNETQALSLSYQATDMVSNVSPIKSKVLIIDSTAPIVDVFAKAVEINGTRYISSKDTVYIEAFDDETIVAEVLYAINEGEFVAYDKQIGINLKEPGNFIIHAKALDIVGNESEVVDYPVVVDILPPTGDTMYIGEVRSTEYDPLSPETTQTPEEDPLFLPLEDMEEKMGEEEDPQFLLLEDMEEETTDMTTEDMVEEDPIMEDANMTTETVEEDPMVEDANMTTETVEEIPAGTGVDAMVTETPEQE